jgi:SpoIID/LytB domain protein
VKAVDQTNAQVLLYHGRPADTVYFSTSKGTTLGNDAVFGSAPLPYLRPVKERDDGASPLSHWTVTLPLGDVARFLRAAGDWGSGGVSSITKTGTNVVVKGGGTSKTLTVTDFRIDMNAWAHCLDPARYPTFEASGLRLPQTVPSKWFSTSKSGGSVVLTGRGWGHGVGMVQWGAYGKAIRGVPYQDILADYYGGLRPVPYDEPTEIRIGIAVGLTSVTVQGTGEVTVNRGNVGSFPWLVTGGKRLRVRHGSAPPVYITGGRIVKGPTRAASGKKVTVTASIPQLSVARLVLRVPGPAIEMEPAKTVQAGTVSVSGTVPDVPSGTYRLQLEVTNGIDIVRTKGRLVRVTGVTASPSLSPPSTSPSPAAVALAPTGSSPAAPVAIGVGGLAAVALALFVLRRTRRRPSVPASRS